VKPRQRKPQRLELFGMVRVAILIMVNWRLAGSVTTMTAVGSVVTMAVICDLYFVVVAVAVQLFSIVYALLHG